MSDQCFEIGRCATPLKHQQVQRRRFSTCENGLPRGWSRGADKAVINAWRALFGELNHGPGVGADAAAIIAWNTRCDDRLVDLLKAMSDALGYSFTSEELRRGIYHPQASVDREQTVLAILQGLRNVLNGQGSLRNRISSKPRPGPSASRIWRGERQRRTTITTAP